MNKLKEFFKSETVLCIATVLAIISMFIIPIDAGYVEYIDVKTLSLLFSLMVVMAGLQKQGVFTALASALLPNAKHTGELRIILVFLCFFTSMLITNDVALITFVPFSIIVYTMANKREDILYVVVLQTIAANLGSMLTPLGNPQNLYLYSISGMNIGEFLMTMLPLTVASGVLLVVCCLITKKETLHTQLEKTAICSTSKEKVLCAFYAVLFCVSLLTVLRIVPYQITFAVALVGGFLTDKEVLKKVDYSLLVTFISFFIFIGNMGRIEAVRAFLSNILVGREVIIGFLSSQAISNVPAAVLLSGFTTNWAELLKGVNIGGLGTLIASMASLISYKLYVKEMPEKKGKYMTIFSIFNIVFAIVLLVLEFIL